jgi:DNA primase
LGRTLDELPPQTRVLLSFLVGMVERECTAQGTRRVEYRFSRRQVREHTRWGDTQLKIHLARLVELEYLLIHRGGRGQSFEYELLYDGVSDEAPHLSGLIDVGVLRTASALPMSCDYDAQRSGQNAHRSGVGRPLVGPQSGAGRAAQHHLNADKTNHNDESSAPEPKTHGTGNGTKPPSYPRSPLAAAGLR